MRSARWHRRAQLDQVGDEAGLGIEENGLRLLVRRPEPITLEFAEALDEVAEELDVLIVQQDRQLGSLGASSTSFVSTGTRARYCSTCASIRRAAFPFAGRPRATQAAAP